MNLKEVNRKKSLLVCATCFYEETETPIGYLYCDTTV